MAFHIWHMYHRVRKVNLQKNVYAQNGNALLASVHSAYLVCKEGAYQAGHFLELLCKATIKLAKGRTKDKAGNASSANEGFLKKPGEIPRKE